MSATFTQSIIPSWEEISWSTDSMATVLSYYVFLIYPYIFLLLLFRDLLFYLPNRQAMQGCKFLTLISLLVIMPLFNNLMKVLKVYLCSICCCTSSLLLLNCQHHWHHGSFNIPIFHAFVDYAYAKTKIYNQRKIGVLNFESCVKQVFCKSNTTRE